MSLKNYHIYDMRSTLNNKICAFQHGIRSNDMVHTTLEVDCGTSGIDFLIQENHSCHQTISPLCILDQSK